MNTNWKIFVSDKLFELIEEESLKQVRNVWRLPWVIWDVLAMPDIHKWYWFPIWWVAAFDIKKWIISPWWIWFDINCWVRLLSSSFKKKDVMPKINELL